MSNTSSKVSSHASELAAEQEFVDRVYRRVDELRGVTADSVGEALQPVGNSRQARLERDILVAERSGLLAALNAVDGSLCFGRIDLAGGERYHIGRIGLREEEPDATGERCPVLIDWRAPVARPFYLATGHTPMGLRRRRHITTRGREVTALHDELLDLADPERTGHEDPTGDAVLLAALDAARTGRMTDIVRTIQAEQDRIIRAPHRGVLVVEGGPGTGKTAVALHRAAYLLYAHREQLARRAVLVVGPNPAFLAYIGGVLPSLGETGVLLASPGELYPGVRATGTDTQRAAAVKGRPEMAEVLAAVVADRQALPEPALAIEHDREVLMLDAGLVRVARDRTRALGLPHNVAREHFEGRILNTLTDMLTERIGTDPYDGGTLLDPSDVTQIRDDLAANPEVWTAVDQLWPRLTPQQLVAGFLADPAHLSEEDAAAVRRTGGPWTPADVPLLDEAAELLGEDDRTARAARARERSEKIAYASGVLEVSYASRTYEFEDQDDEESEVLAAHDVIDAERMAERHEEADHRSAAERAAADRTWAFGHIVVDEAQELSPMTWRLLMRRCPTRSMTLVGDPAQAAEGTGAPDSWEAALAPHVGDRWQRTVLDVNYRTPAEVMDLAAAVVRAGRPGFEPPRSVRATGVKPWLRRAARDGLAAEVARGVEELSAGGGAPGGAPGPSGSGASGSGAPGSEVPGGDGPDGDVPGAGRLAVIAPRRLHPELAAVLPDGAAGEEPDLTRRTVLLDPRQAKGLEFDDVLVVEPGLMCTSDLYVALTRATQQLGVVHAAQLPPGLA